MNQIIRFSSLVRVATILCMLGFSGIGKEVSAQTARFSVNTNSASVINDNVTKLYWQRCIYPYSYSTTASPAGCQKNSSFLGGVGMKWTNAKTYCSQYGTSWRIPTIQELKSIIDRSAYAPALNGIFDPGQASSGNGVPDFFWSSTPYAQNTGNIWTVNFYYGYSFYTAGANNTYYLRCVSETSP
ncbi:DUF1566 domain-containing protein [Leptospira semungkisensis]|uniref:DUF1566 domain-containing protein n=2 Tax=Leptospira semungkisensis TaxID=2484985 RepID=A0A4R9FQP0_9LEPT|nr:DUF1566 domain-containing protein [Leptospira semungkisensis]